MSIFSENRVRLSNNRYYESEIKKIRLDKIILECDNTSVNQNEYDSLVRYIFENPFIKRIKIIWHDTVKLKVLQKLSIALINIYNLHHRSLSKLTLILSIFKPYPSQEMKQNLINIFSIPTNIFSLQIKFRKEFLCFESFFEQFPIPKQQNIQQFQISLEQSGQIKPLDFTFFFSFLQEFLSIHQLTRLGVKVKINQIFYSNFTSFFSFLQKQLQLKDIEINFSDIENVSSYLDSLQTQLFVKENKINPKCIMKQNDSYFNKTFLEEIIPRNSVEATVIDYFQSQSIYQKEQYNDENEIESQLEQICFQSTLDTMRNSSNSFEFNNNNHANTEYFNQSQSFIGNSPSEDLNKSHSNMLYNYFGNNGQKQINPLQNQFTINQSQLYYINQENQLSTDKQDKLNTLRLGNIGKRNERITDYNKGIFKKVDYLIIKDIDIDLVKLLNQLNNLDQLKITNTTTINMFNHFPQQFNHPLTKLTIDQDNLSEASSQKLSKVISELKYIQYLKWHSINQYKDLIIITQNLKQLKELDLKLQCNKGSNQSKHMKEVYKNIILSRNNNQLTKMKIIIEDNNFEYSRLFDMIREHKKLEELTIDMGQKRGMIKENGMNIESLMNRLSDSLCQNKLFSKIQINIPSHLDNISIYQIILKLSQSLPYLTTLDLSSNFNPSLLFSQLLSSPQQQQKQYLILPILKSSMVAFISAYNILISPFMHFNPTLILWDLYI